MSRKELQIRANLKGKDVKNFLKVKERLGLIHNSEVIRVLVKEKSEKLQGVQCYNLPDLPREKMPSMRRRHHG